MKLDFDAAADAAYFEISATEVATKTSENQGQTTVSC